MIGCRSLLFDVGDGHQTVKPGDTTMSSSFGSNSLGEQKRRRAEYLVGLVCTSQVSCWDVEDGRCTEPDGMAMFGGRDVTRHWSGTLSLQGSKWGNGGRARRRLGVDCCSYRGLHGATGMTGFSRFHLTPSRWLAWGRAELVDLPCRMHWPGRANEAPDREHN